MREKTSTDVRGLLEEGAIYCDGEDGDQVRKVDVDALRENAGIVRHKGPDLCFRATSVCTIRMEHPSKRKQTLVASGIEPSRPARGKYHLPHGGRLSRPWGSKFNPPIGQMARVGLVGAFAGAHFRPGGLTPKPDHPPFAPLS